MNIVTLNGKQQHNQPQSPFDSIRHIDENGNEYWVARELMGLLGYTNWRKFDETIQRAITSCQVHNEPIDHHFELELKLAKRPQGGGRKGQDYKLSRYAAYLISLCGDVRKTEIASAQAYFVTKTREAEVREQQERQPIIPLAQPPKPMSQIEILLMAANQLAEQEKRQQELERQQQELEQRQQQTEEALAQIFRARLEATERLNALPAPTVEAPPITTRQLVRRVVNDFCSRSGAKQQDIWKKLYQEIFYRCGICLNRREKAKNQSKLDTLTESELNQLYAIAVEVLVV